MVICQSLPVVFCVKPGSVFRFPSPLPQPGRQAYKCFRRRAIYWLIHICRFRQNELSLETVTATSWRLNKLYIAIFFPALWDERGWGQRLAWDQNAIIFTTVNLAVFQACCYSFLLHIHQTVSDISCVSRLKKKRFTHQMLTLGESVLGGGHWHKVQAVLHRHLNHAILWHIVKKSIGGGREWKGKNLCDFRPNWMEIIKVQLVTFSTKVSFVHNEKDHLC